MKRNIHYMAFLALLSSSVACAGEWVAHSIDQSGRGADGVRFADVNGDSLPDMVSGWEEAGETRIYLHPGGEKVDQPWPKAVVGETGPVEDAVFADLDSDGFADVVSSSENKNLYVHWAPKSQEKYLDANAWTTEVLAASQGVQRWMMTVPIQIDGRNGPDLLAAGKGNQVVWFESPHDARDVSRWKMHVISDQGGWTMGLSAVDMDGDGDLDALLSIRDQNPGIKWLENPGPGRAQETFWKIHHIGEPASMGFVATADLDGDGVDEVISPLMGNEKAVVRVFRRSGLDSNEWKTIEIALPKSRNKGIAVGDIDLDGRVDLVVSHEFAEIHVLRHDGKRDEDRWQIQTIASGGKYDDVTLLDVDGDGDLDVVTTDERGLQVVWYENPVRDGKLFVRIVRPILTEEKYHSSDVENWELMFEARHPDGVKRIRLVGIDAKVPNEPWSDDYNPQTGYFYKARRFKSSAERRYYIEVETGKGEVVRSSKIHTLNNFAHAEGSRQTGRIPEYQGFINLRDGDSVKADTPFYVGVDCMDPDGGFLVEDNRHKADDLNGVLSVTLKIDGKVWKTKTNSTQEPVGTGSETAARSFGLYEFFDVTLSEGNHTLEIESTDRLGNVRSGPSISVKAEPAVR